jgi:hypothetical protein
MDAKALRKKPQPNKYPLLLASICAKPIQITVDFFGACNVENLP